MTISAWRFFSRSIPRISVRKSTAGLPNTSHRYTVLCTDLLGLIALTDPL
jgi:hypothetical protein